ncbi:MAG: hypothetical protein KC561_03140 [Myxococcales bacterium]|nr:hypothetical protein [Myxococcales bacterium]
MARIEVSNQKELAEALSASAPGDFIALRAGDFEVNRLQLPNHSLKLVGAGMNETRLTAMRGAAMWAKGGYGQPTELTIGDVTLRGNGAAEDNGGLLKLNNLIFKGERVRFEHGTTVRGLPLSGGALFAEDSWLILEGCEFVECSSSYGGAIGLRNCGQVRIRSCRFEGTEAEHGGALSSVDTVDLSIDDSSAQATDRGALFHIEPSLFETCRFELRGLNVGGQGALLDVRYAPAVNLAVLNCRLLATHRAELDQLALDPQQKRDALASYADEGINIDGTPINVRLSGLIGGANRISGNHFVD